MKFLAFQSFVFPLMLVLPCAASAHAELRNQWVIGSWVNVRQSADGQSKIIDHLPANTQVKVHSQKDGQCEVAWGNNGHGFVNCKLLGDQALQTNGHPIQIIHKKISENSARFYHHFYTKPHPHQRSQHLKLLTHLKSINNARRLDKLSFFILESRSR